MSTHDSSHGHRQKYDDVEHDERLSRDDDAERLFEVVRLLEDQLGVSGVQLIRQEYVAVRVGTPFEEGDLRLWAAQNPRQRTGGSPALNLMSLTAAPRAQSGGAGGAMGTFAAVDQSRLALNRTGRTPPATAPLGRGLGSFRSGLGLGVQQPTGAIGSPWTVGDSRAPTQPEGGLAPLSVPMSAIQRPRSGLDLPEGLPEGGK